MNWFKYAIDILSSSITIFLELMAYSKINDIKIKISAKNSLIVLFSGLLVVINTYYNGSLIRTFVSFIIILLVSYFILKDDLVSIFYNLLIVYIIAIIYEILLSSLISVFHIFDLSSFDNETILKAVFSFLTLLLTYFTCSIKKIKTFIKKCSAFIVSNRIITRLLTILFVSLIVIDFKYSASFSLRIYIGNIILIISIFLFFYVCIQNYYKVRKEKEKLEVLLGFMTKYEKMIDDNRISKHELLNNLLMLKSIDNKNTKSFNDELDKLIDQSSNKGIKIKNIYKLPSGLKGIIYYKLYGLDDNGYDINISVSKGVNRCLKSISHDDYVSLYKIVGIILDNAIEAAGKSGKKYIVIDVYNESNKTIIEISNSFKGHVDLDKINKKYYSTKGKGRGLGLYLLKSLSNSSKNIEVIQSVEKHIFTSKIIVKENEL